MVLIKLSLIFFLLLVLVSCKGFSSSSEHLMRAESYSSDGDYTQAIKEYRKHITTRLHTKKKPDWENPYFYLIIIGDIYVKQNQLELALKEYEMAETQGVDNYLIADRFRYVARIYEMNKEYQAALDILTKYRERDPILFDLVRDRIAKEMTLLEDQKNKVVETEARE